MMSKIVKKLTITRWRWYRGHGPSHLLKNNLMCPLGFLAEKLGHLLEDFDNVAYPSEVAAKGTGVVWPDALVKTSVKKYKQYDEIEYIDTPLCVQIVRVSDAKNIREPERERRLIQLFKKAGIQVKFV